MWKALGAAAIGAAIVLAGVAYGSRYAGTLINNQPPAQPLGLSSMDLSYRAHEFKFGANDAVGANWEDVWDGGGIYNWLTSAITMQVSSSSTADTGAGTGCRNVTINGLDANFAQISDDITTTGQTAAAGSKQFYRVFRVYCNTNGSGGLNAGTVYISDSGTSLGSGVPSDATKIRAQIGITNGQSLMALYTIPAGYDGRLLSFAVGNNDDTKATTFQIMAREPGQGWRVRWQGVANGGMHEDNVVVPTFTFPPQTDIRVRAKTDTPSAGANATLQLGLY